MYKNICAVFDIQGYFVGDVFYPRELAIVNNDHQLCFELESELTAKDKGFHKTNRILYKNEEKIHGIPIANVLNTNSRQVIKFKDVPAFIITIYNKLTTADKPFVGVKNRMLFKILFLMKIPTFDLTTKNCPNYLTFEKANKCTVLCPLHLKLMENNNNNSVVKCSLKKAFHLWNWLSNNVASIDLFSYFRDRVQVEEIIKKKVVKFRDCADQQSKKQPTKYDPDRYFHYMRRIVNDIQKCCSLLTDLKVDSSLDVQKHYLFREFDDWYLANVSLRPQATPSYKGEDTVQHYTLGVLPDKSSLDKRSLLLKLSSNQVDHV